MIAAAQGELYDRLGPALHEFAKTAPELATLLRVVTDELADPRIHGFGISLEAIAMLHDSARTLTNLQDNASTLAHAANMLSDLANWTIALQEAADKAHSAANALAEARITGGYCNFPIR